LVEAARERPPGGDEASYLTVAFAASFDSWPWALALVLCVLAFALCSVFFGSLLTAALVFSLPCLAVSDVALPASLAAVVACAWTPAAPIRKAMAMSAFFMVSFMDGSVGNDCLQPPRSRIV